MIESFSKFLVMVALVFSSNAFAAGEKTYSVKDLVDQYYSLKEARQITTRLLSPKPSSASRYCPPNGPACLDVACQKLGQFGCDDMSEIKEVSEACRGNYDGSCLSSACRKLGQFGCDDMSEIKKVARACVGNRDSDCFDSVCQRLGQFGCDDFSEIDEVLKTCAGN